MPEDLEKDQQEAGRAMAAAEKETTTVPTSTSEDKAAPKKKRGRPSKAKVEDSKIKELEDLIGKLALKLEDAEKKIAERPPATVRLDTSKKKIVHPPKVGDPGVNMRKVKFVRNDQPDQPMNVYVRNRFIEWKGTLIDGKEYELPSAVVDHLNSRAVPKYEQRPDPENPRIMRPQITGYRQRCMCIPVGANG